LEKGVVGGNVGRKLAKLHNEWESQKKKGRKTDVEGQVPLRIHLRVKGILVGGPGLRGT